MSSNIHRSHCPSEDPMEWQSWWELVRLLACSPGANQSEEQQAFERLADDLAARK